MYSLPTITSQVEKKKGLQNVWGSLGTSEEHAKMFIRGYMVPMEQCDKVCSHIFGGENKKFLHIFLT